MVSITARIDTEISINYMWHGKDKMDDKFKSCEIYTEGRSFPYRGMYSCLFLSKYSISNSV